MPQPLSKVCPNGTYKINNMGFKPTPFSRNADLSVYALEAIATWSGVESYMLSLYIEIMGGDASLAATTFMSVDAQGPRNAMLQAAAKEVLSKEQLDLLNVLLSFAKSCQRGRNKLAHWDWGYCDEIPDAFLLVDHKKCLSGPPDRSEIFVYRKKDFEEITDRNHQVAFYFSHFARLLRMDGGPGNQQHPASKSEWQRLFQTPEIAVKLSQGKK